MTDTKKGTPVHRRLHRRKEDAFCNTDPLPSATGGLGQHDSRCQPADVTTPGRLRPPLFGRGGRPAKDGHRPIGKADANPIIPGNRLMGKGQEHQGQHPEGTGKFPDDRPEAPVMANEHGADLGQASTRCNALDQIVPSTRPLPSRSPATGTRPAHTGGIPAVHFDRTPFDWTLYWLDSFWLDSWKFSRYRRPGDISVQQRPGERPVGKRLPPQPLKRSLEKMTTEELHYEHH